MSSIRQTLIADKPSRVVALIESALVILIWASSYVIIRLGVGEQKIIGPLTLAGIRYTLGALILFPFMFRVGNPFRSLSPSVWQRLFWLGVSSYTIANGALYWALQYISSTTSSFILSLVPLMMLFASTIFLNERPTRQQVLGVLISIAGSMVFFARGFEGNELTGVIVVSIGTLGFVAFGVLGRGLARSGQTDALTMSALPLFFGGGITLIIALISEGVPNLSLYAWGIIFWLAIINTAFAYTLYNHSLRVLTAVEMGAMRNSSPLWTALFAWVLLGEVVKVEQLIGIVVVIVGVTMVQWKRKNVAA